MTKLIIGGLMLATSTLALGQVEPPTKPQIKIDGTTQEAIDFSDPGNTTAKALAASLGISVGEATSRLRAQVRMAKVVADLQAKHPDFAGLKVDQQGGFKIRALFKGNSDRRAELATASNGNGIGRAIEQGTAMMSMADSSGFRGRMASVVRGQGKRAVFSVDEETGEVTIGGPEDASLRKAAEQSANGLTIKVTFDPTLDIVETTYAIAGQEFNGDGSAAEFAGCTTGFSVQNVVYGTTTAGHCQNTPAQFNTGTNSTYGAGRPLVFKQEWKTNTDVQFHTLSSTSDEPAPYYWDGTKSVGITSSYKTAIPAGYGMCKFGRTTRFTCGTTGSTVTDTNYPGAVFYSVSATTDMNDGGDSGGPVVNGQTAYGWVHGRNTVHPYKLYYSAIVDVYRITPLRLIVCATTPC